MAYACLIPLIVLIDYLSKQWAQGIFGGVQSIIPRWFEFRVVFNRGLFGGLGDQLQGRTASMVTIGASLLAVLLLCLLAYYTPKSKVSMHFGIACMLGGALGNTLDRILSGQVTDFIHIFPLPIFNLADVAVVIGIVLTCKNILAHNQE